MRPTRNQMAHAKDRSGFIAVQNAVSSYRRGTPNPVVYQLGATTCAMWWCTPLALYPGAAETWRYATRTR